MMIEAPATASIDVAVVAENESRERDAVALAARLRVAGIATELFLTGSPRKRYDRAMKIRPAAIISFDLRDGVASHGFKLLDADNTQAVRAQEIFDQR